MQFNQKTILGLFDSSQKCFVIPVYQRAYSWEKEHWSVFLNDLKEQISGNNNYFYGNILLEIIRKDLIYEVIDGQQRLTTLVIFMRSLIDILGDKKISNDIVDLSEKEKIYFKNNGNIKLRVVDYDRACFESIIINGNDDYKATSHSQKRIKNAKKYFYDELSKLDLDSIIKILDKIESTEITSIELEGKKESALMFELENNRGKELTNLERLKSYFMYQTYIYSVTEEIEQNINYISDIFKSIYLIVNDINFINEDSILIYHCNAYVNGYQYRTIDDIKSIFKKSKHKVEWIKEFIEELHTTFSNIKKLETCKSSFWFDLKALGSPAFIYPFIIKGYKYYDDKIDHLFQILEILVFRYKLVNSRADLISRLNEVLHGFNGDLKELKISMNAKLEESWYWSKQRTLDVINDYMYGNGILNYILWKYENSIQFKNYTIAQIKIINESIEHISPQVPPENENIQTGYETTKQGAYSESFIEDYLNCIGNLMLISDSHNSSIGNRAFKKKLHSFINNPLLKQQAEIQEFISGSINNPIWDSKAIDKRHDKIIRFFKEKWDYDQITL